MTAKGGPLVNVAASLACVGAQLALKMISGATYYADVKVRPQRDGTVWVWFWGTSAPTKINVTDVVLATAADVTSHAQFTVISTRQKTELEGPKR